MRHSTPQFGQTDPMLQGAHRLLRARVDELRARSGDQACAELEELERALARMADGTWGNCEGCSGAIGRDRLRALPETRKCLHCATSLL
jgi:RNA polymerase-binding transcription factor DksA